jgi:hypothetical protein
VAKTGTSTGLVTISGFAEGRIGAGTVADNTNDGGSALDVLLQPA